MTSAHLETSPGDSADDKAGLLGTTHVRGIRAEADTDIYAGVLEVERAWAWPCEP